MDYNININSISLYTDLIKNVLISICTYITFLKISNIKIKNLLIEGVTVIAIFCIVSIVILIRYHIDYYISIFVLIVLLSIIFSFKNNNEYLNSIIITVIAISINYIVYFFDIFLAFCINIIYCIENDNVNLIIIFIIHILLLYKIFKIKRIKNGISYIKNKTQVNNYLELIILNVSMISSFSFIIHTNSDLDVSRKMFIIIGIYAIIMFVTIQKSIQAYYKQKLLIQDLNETKKELEEKKKELTELEKENLNFSMKSHSIAHKQKSLEYKLNKILQSSELSEEIDLKDRMESVAKEVYAIPIATKLIKTEVENIDDMLEFMQAECVKNNIEFDLKINGNIHKMINNYIEKDDLEILLADHIKDAIIAINHTENINRSILVKIGEFDNCYSLNIYDSGINFSKEVLENLGKKPVTSYPNEGGTGMGYMNTFKTLGNYKASLTIEEFGKPSKDNFTKVITIKFDKKNEFKIL